MQHKTKIKTKQNHNIKYFLVWYMVADQIKDRKSLLWLKRFNLTRPSYSSEENKFFFTNCFCLPLFISKRGAGVLKEPSLLKQVTLDFHIFHGCDSHTHTGGKRREKTGQSGKWRPHPYAKARIRKIAYL